MRPGEHLPILPEWLAGVDRVFAATIEASEDALVGADLNGHVVLWSRGAERTFGYAPHEMLGQPLAAAIVPPTRTDEEAQIWRRISAGDPVKGLDTVRRRKDGGYVNVSLSASPVTNDTGQIVGGLQVLRDTTAERQAADELRRSEERYRVTLASIGDAVVATDMLGRVTFMNPVAEELTGWRENEGRLQPFEDVLPLINEETRRKVENPVARVLREGLVVGLNSVPVAPGTTR